MNNIISAVSTNFTTFKNSADLRKLIDVGLDYLIISLDGATKKTYEKIRVGAQFEQVISNIKEIVRLKKLLKSKIPFIEIQFIIFEDNIHEMEAVKRLSIELGVDRFLTKEAYEYRLKNVKHKLQKVEPCYWLWYVLNVAWSGELKACCTSGLMSSFSFGDIIKKPVLAGWNDQMLTNLRQLFVKNDQDIATALKGCKCLKCYKLEA